MLSGDASLAMSFGLMNPRIKLPAGSRNGSHSPYCRNLGAEEIRSLFDRLRGAYDYIIVDLTPLVPIIDVRATQGLVDHYVFVIEWGMN